MVSVISVDYAQSAPSPGNRGRLGWGRSLSNAPCISFVSRRSNAVTKRNVAKLPADFSHTEREFTNLRSQFVTSSWGGTRYLPLAFSEQGVAMLSSVLRSPRAVEVNIEIMRAFVQMRAMIDSNKVLSRKVAEMEAEYDEQFAVVFKAIRELMDDKAVSDKQAAKPKRKIGFT